MENMGSLVLNVYLVAPINMKQLVVLIPKIEYVHRVESVWVKNMNQLVVLLPKIEYVHRVELHVLMHLQLDNI